MSEKTDIDGHWAELRRSGRILQFWLLCLGIWLHAADSLLVATAMPKAVAEIGGDQLVSWTLSLYLLGSILSGAGAALAATAFGLRRAFVLAAGCYALGCAVSALAPDMIVMLAGRLAQGIGGGWLVALAYVAIQRLFPQEVWPRLIGIMSAVWGVSAFCGPLIGGFFADLGLWRWGFWAFALQALVLCVLIPAFLTPDRPVADADRPRFPTIRLAILSVAVLLISGAAVAGSPWGAAAMCIAGFLAYGFFLLRDARMGAQRMFPPGVLDVRTTLGAGFVANLGLSAAAASFMVYAPFLLATLHGVSALGAGYIIALESIAWSVMAIVFAGAGPQGELRLIRYGAALIAAAIAGLAIVMPTGPLWLIVALTVVQGAGFGMLWGFLIRKVVAAAPPAHRDSASSAMPATQQIAFATGAALSGIVANMAGFAEGISAQNAPPVAFWVFAAFVPIALIGVYGAWRVR